MPLHIVRDNIVHMDTDAIVNAANTTLTAGGGVCGSIFDAAGYDKMEKACKRIGSCEVGKAVVTSGYRLRAKYVIHAVGPVWRGGNSGEEAALRSAYRSALETARRRRVRSIAFPLISTGIYGYPKSDVLTVAVSEITAFLMKNEMDIYIVVYDRESYLISGRLIGSIKSYIDDKYVDMRPDTRRQSGRLYQDSVFGESRQEWKQYKKSEYNGGKTDKESADALEEEHRKMMDGMLMQGESAEEDYSAQAYMPIFDSYQQADAPVKSSKHNAARSLKDLLKQVEEPFSVSLLRLIDKSGKTDVEIYKKANIDRKHFSKIRSNRNYKPTKQTVLAFAIALELSLDETRDLLARAGFALSHSSKYDIVIEYFIVKKNYNIHEINEALYELGLPILI